MTDSRIKKFFYGSNQADQRIGPRSHPSESPNRSSVRTNLRKIEFRHFLSEKIGVQSQAKSLHPSFACIRNGKRQSVGGSRFPNGAFAGTFRIKPDTDTEHQRIHCPGKSKGSPCFDIDGTHKSAVVEGCRSFFDNKIGSHHPQSASWRKKFEIKDFIIHDLCRFLCFVGFPR